MRIDTDIPEIIVEIDDREYPVAPRTVAVCEKLLAAEKACLGKPQYVLWLQELEILLGKGACKELFPDGKAENVDRIQRIYAGVAGAFNHTSDEIGAQGQAQKLEALATALAPLNELLRHVRALDKTESKGAGGNIREIRRPE